MIEFSEIQNSYYLLPLVGLIVGLFGTMLGGGGGFFFLPMLTLLIGVPAQTAVITSLVATLPICIVGSLSHYHKGNINFKIGALYALAGIAGAFLGAQIASRISTEQLKISFGIYSVIIALNIGWDTWRRKEAEKNGNGLNKLSQFTRISKSSLFGFFSGTITGTFGTSGTATVLAGLFSLNIPLKMVIG
ncbi:MAG TPA: sulfite exporter TauE/SafE family protein, partial [Bacteroidales bacterium]|nr:sulfite exporter TauE/SafE family protein [Bacteroidales bacterium]